MVDISAFLLMALSFLLPLTSRELRRGTAFSTLAFCTILACHHAVSLFNVYGGTVFGAGSDAAAFHNTAAANVENQVSAPFGLGALFYESYLTQLYYLFGSSLLLAQTMVILAFSGSLLCLLRIKNLLRVQVSNAALIFVFGLEPFILLWGSINLREPYQIFFLLLALQLGLKGRLENRPMFLFGAALAAIPLGLSHNGLAVYAPFLFMLLMIWKFDARKVAKGKVSIRRLRWRMVAGIVSAALVVIVSQLPGVGALEAVQQGSVLEYASNYRENSSSNVGGSSYGKPLDVSSASGFLSTGSNAVVHYFFGPLPWEIRGVVDALASGVRLFHLLLLGFAIALWRSESGERRHAVAFLLTAYIALELLWASGTTNYGTGMRHHMVGYGIIVVLGMPGLVRRLVGRRQKRVLVRRPAAIG